jgi:O-antigen/teichoic acid export membrane protein
MPSSPSAQPAALPGVGRTRAALISLAGSYLGTLLSIVKGILFVPLYLRFFGTDLYGAWLATGNVVGLLGLVDGGLTSVAFQKLGEAWGAGARERFSDLAAASLALVAGLGGVIAIAGAIISPWVPRLINASPGGRSTLTVAFMLAALGAAATLIASCLIAIPTSWQRPEIGAASRVSGQLTETAMIGVGMWMKWGLISLAIGAIAGAFVSLTICATWTAIVWRKLGLATPRLRRAELVELARTTAPLMVSRVVLQIDGNIEVALVSAFISPAAAAIYGITDRIFRTAVSFINPLAGSVVSGLAHYVGERGRVQSLAPSRELIAIWSLIVAAALPPLLAINGDFTVLWVGAANYGGLPLSAALLINETLGAREWVFSVILLATGAIAVSAYAATVECLVRIPVMYLAIKRVGWLGLPWAQGAVTVLALIACAWFAGAQFELPPRKRFPLALEGVLALVISFAIGLAEAIWLPAATSWPRLVLKASAVGTLHLLISLTLAGGGRRALYRRLADGRFPWLARFAQARSQRSQTNG